MINRQQVDIPIYDSGSFEYIRISDIQDLQDRRNLRDFMYGQTIPVIWDNEYSLLDAVYLWDYLNYLSAKEGGYVFWD